MPAIPEVDNRNETNPNLTRLATASTGGVRIDNAQQIFTPPEPGLKYLRQNRANEYRLAGGSLTITDQLFASPSERPAVGLTIDGSGCAVIPGFVDSHTHLPFVGWRANEFADKIAGVSYTEISKKGGGIAASAKSLHEHRDEVILAQSSALADEMLVHGTTAFECKSGYGLSIEQEQRSLHLADKLANSVAQTTVSTALLAHALPSGHDGDSWVAEIEQHLPELIRTTGVSGIDIYVESVAFSNRHLEQFGRLARSHDLRLHCHVEQFATHRSIEPALASNARSVDHLSCLHPDDVIRLAESECTAVLLPGAEFLGDESLAPARALADAGAICGLATDLNPGTSPICSMPLIIGIAIRRYGWTIKEALLATTLNTAWALGLSAQIGTIEPGKQADFVLLDGPVEMIPYRFGHNPVGAVFIAGRPVWVRDDFHRRFKINQ